MNDEEELEKIQDELTEEVLEGEKDEMKVENRSIFTIREEIIKKAESTKDDTK